VIVSLLYGAFFGPPHEALLIFEYCAFPSMKGFAKDLARKNKALHGTWREYVSEDRKWKASCGYEVVYNEHGPGFSVRRDRGAPPPPPHPPTLYGPRGSTDWRAMLQQIKRVLRKHKEAYAAIKSLSPEERDELHRAIAHRCQTTTALRLEDPPKGWRPRRRVKQPG
jgi:hypothetical protein